MALGGMGLFLLEAGAGTALLLQFFPTGTLGPGFFALHGGLACLFVGMSAMTHPPGLSMTLAGMPGRSRDGRAPAQRRPLDGVRRHPRGPLLRRGAADDEPGPLVPRLALPALPAAGARG